MSDVQAAVGEGLRWGLWASLGRAHSLTRGGGRPGPAGFPEAAGVKTASLTMCLENKDLTKFRQNILLLLSAGKQDFGV